ncbi:Chondroitin sulfate synthase 2, partial [Pseudolycoriella hygida]
GIVLSSSAIKKIRGNLDWCVRNARSSDHSTNIGACVEYSTKLSSCYQSFQGVEYKSIKINTYNIYHDLVLLSMDPLFNDGFIFHPINTAEGILTLHTYFSRLNLEAIKSSSMKLKHQIHNISNGSISNGILEVKWPEGVPESENPETRHDIVPWQFLNLTHQFMPDHEQITKMHSLLEANDLKNILNHTIVYAKKLHNDLHFLRTHSMYRRFDAVRGMTYQLHLNFKSSQGDVVLKSTRVALLVPVFEYQIVDALNFVIRYEKMCMESQDNTFLMLIFLYNVDSPNKGDQDLFLQLKKIALELSDKYRNIGSRIAWLSIRLTPSYQTSGANASMLTSTYAQNEILSLVVTDLALRKIGLESLVMMGSVSMTFKADFLNRVRMNTVQGFQIFSPIGFMMYPCDITKLCKECDSCDVSQATGYFDKVNVDVLAFYSGDYVEARKLLEAQVPIVRTDNDIDLLMNRSDKSVKNILDMFVKSKSSLHVLRAIEPNLRFGATVKEFLSKTKEVPICPYWYTDSADQCVHIFSRKQVGDVLIKSLIDKR